MKLVSKGLEGMVVADTKISFIDGERGRLLYRGYDINDLAKNCSYEEVCHLLLFHKLPTKKQLYHFNNNLKEKREIPVLLQRNMELFCKELLPIDALRTAVSLMKCFDPCQDTSIVSTAIRGVDLIAKFPTIVAYSYRLSQGMKLVRPKKELGHAENFLYMLNGKRPDAFDAKVIDIDMVLHAEHSFNASTFSARVTASTLSDIYAAITSAVGTLKGPLHGGAASSVVKMLWEIGDAKNAEAYVKDALASKRKIMGFGHRVYKTHDPRAIILKETARKVGSRKGNLKFYNILVNMEQVMEKQGLYKKGVYPNVDLYTGTTYKNIGIPEPLFDPMFALGRISGWVAHVIEQLQDNKIIRPLAKYTGPMDLKFVPIGRRK